MSKQFEPPTSTGLKAIIPLNWSQISASRVVRDDGCEISRQPKTGALGPCWTAMVPAMQEELAWHALTDEVGIITFSSLAAAIVAVETYLGVFAKKFPNAEHNRERVDLSADIIRVSGGGFGQNSPFTPAGNPGLQTGEG